MLQVRTVAYTAYLLWLILSALSNSHRICFSCINLTSLDPASKHTSSLLPSPPQTLKLTEGRWVGGGGLQSIGLIGESVAAAAFSTVLCVCVVGGG